MSKANTRAKKVPLVAFATPHVLALATVAGPDVRAIHRINQALTVIGRDRSADFTIADPEISSRHLEIKVDAGQVWLQDLGSSNGTQINRRPVGSEVSHRLRHLDEIEIGATRLLFLMGRFAER